MLGIQTSRDSAQQTCESLAGLCGVALEKEYGEHARCGQDRALLGHPLVGRAARLGGRRHQRATERGEQQEREHFLPDSLRVLGVELALTDVVALLEPIEEFDLPTSLVEIADVRAAEWSVRERREEYLRLAVRAAAAHRAQPRRRQDMRRTARRGIQ